MHFGGLGGGVGIISWIFGIEKTLGILSVEEIGRALVVVCCRSESSGGLVETVEEHSVDAGFGGLEDWLELLELRGDGMSE